MNKHICYSAQQRMQDMYDVSAIHLLTQGERSRNGHLCRYRLPSRGLMCGIGPLIKDEVYDESLEGQPVTSQAVIHAIRASGWDISGMIEVDFLQNIQRIHDSYRTNHWPVKLLHIAHEYHLDPQVVYDWQKVSGMLDSAMVVDDVDNSVTNKETVEVNYND